MINVLKHISFARDWLDRAEKKVKIGNVVEGEVYLSLAEAEIRKAWEDSYFPRKKAARKGFQLNKKILSLAIGLILIFIVVFTNYLYAPIENSEQLELRLTDDYYTFREDNYRGEKEIRLINDNFMLENNNNRRR